MIPPDRFQRFYVKGTGVGEWEAAKPLVLTAPQGYLLRMDNVNDEYGPRFNVYNGDVADPVGSNAELMSRPAIAKTMTIVYVGTGEYDMSTYVELIEVKPYAIQNAMDPKGNGTISASTESAYAGDTVTLTTTPDEGYVLSGIDVWWIDENDNNKYVEVRGVTWYNNEAKFVMPFADVNYRAFFSPIDDYGELAVSIPKTGSMALDIPSGAQSIYLINELSDDGNYIDNADGVVTLTAPEGYALYINGYIDIADENDSLIVFDGNSMNADTLLVKNKSTYIGTFSSSRSLTFRFKSNENANDYGLKLYIDIVKKINSFAAVSVYEDMYENTIGYVNGDYAGTDAVSIPGPIDVDWVEFDREFTPKVATTVVLPFKLPENSTVNGKFYKLSEVKQVGNAWKAFMTWIGENVVPEANQPYAFIVNDDENRLQISGYDNAKISLQTAETAEQVDISKNWIFKGTYSFKTWDDYAERSLAYAFAGRSEKGISKGKFGKVAEDSYANPLRAYLCKRDASVRLQPQGRPIAKNESFVGSIENLPETIDIEFRDTEEKTTAVGRLNTVTGEIQIDRWYDLKGRKLDSKPTTKGTYFNNHKRVIVK